MYLKELSIKNFKSFYGYHNFSLNKGPNIIIGGNGEGKTNFCKAIEFALYGAIGLTSNKYTSASMQYPSLINKSRVDEADSERDWIGCEVRLLFARARECVYVDEDLSRNSHEYRNESRGQVMFESLNKIIDNNVRNGFGFLILDDSLARFNRNYTEKALALLEESALDQIILLMGTSLEAPAYLSSKVIRLGKTIESVTFKVHDARAARYQRDRSKIEVT